MSYKVSYGSPFSIERMQNLEKLEGSFGTKLKDDASQADIIYVDPEKKLIGLVLKSEAIVYHCYPPDLTTIFYKTGYDVKKLDPTARRNKIPSLLCEAVEKFFDDYKTSEV